MNDNDNRSGFKLAHPVLKTYARRNGLRPEDFRSDGRVVLRVDGKYRVNVQPAADGRLAFTCSLIDLSSLPAGRADSLLTQLAQLASPSLRDHPAGLAIDSSGERLVLQQALPSNIEVGDFETELAEFINVLAFWQPAVSRDTVMSGGV